jgi:nucleotide-binding universal stress UspA family protein
MLRIRKILFPTDFSTCAEQAMGRALHLARRHGAELHLLHVLVLHEYDPLRISAHVSDIAKLQGLLVENAEAALDEVAARLRSPELRVVAAQERGISAADPILDYADRQDIDLVVMGTHGRRGARRFLLGSIAERVVKLARCPVLSVRDPGLESTTYHPSRILVPLDFSEHARNAFRHARELAAEEGASIQLLHIVEETPVPYFYGPGTAPRISGRAAIHARAREEMRRLIQSSAGPEAHIEIHVARGSSALDISRFARESRSDLVVIATHGLSSVWQYVMGSVAEAVVRTAPCPVLTVKAFGKSLVD